MSGARKHARVRRPSPAAVRRALAEGLAERTLIFEPELMVARDPAKSVGTAIERLICHPTPSLSEHRVLRQRQIIEAIGLLSRASGCLAAAPLGPPQ